MRLAIGTLIAAWAACGGAIAHANGVVLAIRKDAPPFAEQSADGSFGGLLVEICEAAVARAGYEVRERRGILASDRAAAIDDEEVDLICDPMTVTLARARNVDFSPIVFIANSGFYTSAELHYLDAEDFARFEMDDVSSFEECAELHSGDPDRRLVGVGLVGETTASATFDRAQSRGLVGSSLDHAVCRILFRTHADGVNALCDGRVSYYFGDLDIIREEVGRRDDCRARRPAEFGVYEPYALAIPSDDADFRRAFVAGLYELFTDGTVRDAYLSTFATDELAEPHATLFRVYNVPLGGSD